MTTTETGADPVTPMAGLFGASPDERASRRRRGLAIGALVGMAIVGSTVWQRRRVRQRIRRELLDSSS